MRKVKAMKVSFSEAEKNNVINRMIEVLDTGMVVASQNVQDVEILMEKGTSAKHAVAVSSGTFALEAIYSGLQKLYGIKKVMIPCNTFIATGLAARHAGLDVESCSIGEDLMIDKDAVIRDIKRSNVKGAVVVVHIGGEIMNSMASFVEEVEALGWYVVEDAAHAIGSTKNGVQAGTFGIAGAFSFFSTKVLTGGEGGVVTTDDDKLAEYCDLYRNFGKKSSWVTEYDIIGYNGRMNEFGACLIVEELKAIETVRRERARIYRAYKDNLDSDYELINEISGTNSLHYKVMLRVNTIVVGMLKTHLLDNGVELPGEVYDKPLDKFKIFDDKEWFINNRVKDDLSEMYCKGHVCLPIYRGMEEEDVKYVCELINNFLKSSSILGEDNSIFPLVNIFSKMAII